MRDVPVSILLGVYNGEPYVSEAIEDLLAQTFTDFELVIVDDGSTDGTARILERYAKRDPRVAILRNDKNAGLATSLNRGLEHCRGEFIARADADDRYAPDRLAHQVSFLNAHPEVGLLGSAFHREDAGGRLLNTIRPPTEDRHIRFRQLFMNSFAHSGVMFRAGVVREVGGYDPTYWTAQDSDLWARIRTRTRMANLPQTLLRVRVLNSSLMRTRGEEGRTLSLSVSHRLLSEYLQRPLGLDEARAIVTLYQGFEHMQMEEISRGLEGLHEVMRRAETVESADTIRLCKREASASLLKHSIRLINSHRSLSRTLMGEAVRWDPRLMLTKRMTKQAARFCIPARARRLLVAAKRRVADSP